jgi:hypothetical protein
MRWTVRIEQRIEQHRQAADQSPVPCAEEDAGTERDERQHLEVRDGLRVDAREARGDEQRGIGEST